MHPYLVNNAASRLCPHWIGNQAVESAGPIKSVRAPYTGEAMFTLHEADSALVDRAVQTAKNAFPDWARTPIKERTQILFRFREELFRKMDEIVATKSFESGKSINEARAGLMKGIEVLEFAISLQNMDVGGKIEVSRGVHCEYRRIPLGVVAGITPFNFPAMVPMWMIPIALALGNCFLWKPSDKTPMTSLLIAECLKAAGLPSGVFSVVQGGQKTVESILDHPDVPAIGFVGSTAVAQAIYQRGTRNFKRVLALGGAKNHVILLPDADPQMAAEGIRDSFTGCAGQRCMAASVLLTVGKVDSIVEKAVELTKKIVPGETMGAIITQEQVTFLKSAIDRAEAAGARVLLDGRKFKATGKYSDGNWLAPTILDHVKPGSEAAIKELFGPILSIVRCRDLSEALSIERSNHYGNATSIFTNDGGLAEEVARSATSGMIGINIGVPVPREPFSFGGTGQSKFGHGDITGVHSLDFWSDLKKVTTKWSSQSDRNWMS